MAADVARGLGSAVWDFLFRKDEAPRAPNIHKEAAEGARAKALLDNESFQDAVRQVREGIHIRWAKSPITDKEGQHELRLMLKVLDDIVGNIREVAQTGMLASEQLKGQRDK